MIASKSVLWLGVVSLIAASVADRMPPKLLKVKNNVGKALHAGRYTSTMIPLPPKIVLHANLAKKEVHLPNRFHRQIRRPYNKRNPWRQVHREYPNEFTRGKFRGQRHPGEKFSVPARPPIRDSDYYEQEVEENGSDMDYEFEDSYRGYSGQNTIQAAESRPSYKSNRIKNVRNGNSEEIQESVTARKPRPPQKAKVGANPYRHDFGEATYRPYHEEEETDEEDYEEDSRPRRRVKLRRHKPREKPETFEGPYSQEFENQDNYYHDRAFDSGSGFSRDQNDYQSPSKDDILKSRERPDYEIWSDPIAKQISTSWNQYEEHKLTQPQLPSKEKTSHFPKLLEPIHVIPVWHILPQYPGISQSLNSDESKSVYAWVNPKSNLKFKFSSKKKESTDSKNEVLADRLVTDSIKWNSIQHTTPAYPNFNKTSDFWGSSDKQWSVVIPEEQVFYQTVPSKNSLITSKHQVPDIGYGQGMELVNGNEEIRSWQVY